jgi:predicted N-acyltransferase
VKARVAASIADVDAAAWNALPGADAPFLRHEFLHALEASGCATAATGWKGCHVLLEDEAGRLGMHGGPRRGTLPGTARPLSVRLLA